MKNATTTVDDRLAVEILLILDMEDMRNGTSSARYHAAIILRRIISRSGMMISEWDMRRLRNHLKMATKVGTMSPKMKKITLSI